MSRGEESARPGPRCKWRESCGVVGIVSPDPAAARLAYFGLFTLQHRGQESAGIAAADGERMQARRGMGLVQGVFTERELGELPGWAAVGHVRYSTTGSTLLCNAQPLMGSFRGGEFAVGHNGNLVNASKLKDDLSGNGHQFQTTTDTELIAAMIAESDERTLEDAVAAAMPHLHGAYSLVLLAKDRVVGVRDPHGIRPLCIGRRDDGGHVLASETCALPVLQARFLREVEPGEVVTIDRGGVREFQAMPVARKAMCIFEFIYFARPDSDMYGKSLYICRKRMGHVLAREHPASADLVVPVPESGISHAIGFAEASKIPFGEALIKNRYIFRTFIEPSQAQRDLGVRMKFTPLAEAVEGKRVVLVDDSIVRGTTHKQLVGMVREAGAREVHLRVSSPPLRHPCYYGIDMDNQEQFIAWHMSVEEVGQRLNADSIGYLSIDGLIEAVGLPRSNFCLACFNNRYPIPVPRKLRGAKLALETRGAPVAG